MLKGFEEIYTDWVFFEKAKGEYRIVLKATKSGRPELGDLSSYSILLCHAYFLAGRLFQKVGPMF